MGRWRNVRYVEQNEKAGQPRLTFTILTLGRRQFDR